MPPMTREYGQFCGLARALELVGGRWTLLIVADLLNGPMRFGELQEGLHGIPTNILSSRLRELEAAGLVERKLLEPRSSSVVYTLTPYGRALEEPIVRLGLWGAASLGEPKETDFFRSGSFALALRGGFHPEKAEGKDLLFEIRFDDRRLYVSVNGGAVTFPTAPESKLDATLHIDPRVLAELLTGHLDFDSAIASSRVEVDGSRREARRFFEIFSLPTPTEVPA